VAETLVWLVLLEMLNLISLSSQKTARENHLKVSSGKVSCKQGEMQMMQLLGSHQVLDPKCLLERKQNYIDLNKKMSKPAHF